MSLKELQETIRGIPSTLETQVIGYAKSVNDVLPEIFEGAGRSFDSEIGDQLVFLAGIKKLHGIVASTYWTLDNSGRILEDLEVSTIRAGALDLSLGGKIHAQLKSLLDNLEKALEEAGIQQYLNSDYETLIGILSSNERR
jgi:hypothetical protein